MVQLSNHNLVGYDLLIVTLAGILVCPAGARLGVMVASCCAGDLMHMGDVVGNEAGEEANGDTGRAMFDIICAGK